jgi:hypothetical protein
LKFEIQRERERKRQTNRELEIARDRYKNRATEETDSKRRVARQTKIERGTERGTDREKQTDRGGKKEDRQIGRNIDRPMYRQTVKRRKKARELRQMGTFAETAIFDYRLSYTDQGNGFPFAYASNKCTLPKRKTEA